MLLGLHKNLSFNSGKIYPYATGGDYVYLYEDTETGKTYRVHEFLSTGTSTLNVEVGGQMEYLIVGGGGSGGSFWGGGGGAGGFRSGTFTTSATSYSITVGTGGAKVIHGYVGNDGGDSSAFSITSTGGGGGARRDYDGRSGGSGGGGSRSDYSSAGTGTPGQGNDGGVGVNSGSSNSSGGGGGGAGSAGGDGSISTGGAGGSGREWPSGSGTFYAGGGGGSGTSGGPGGSGGGGAGNRNANASDGTANTGGGGGGSQESGFYSGNGGSGIVIVRYVVAERKLWTPAELNMGNQSSATWMDSSEYSSISVSLTDKLGQVYNTQSSTTNNVSGTTINNNFAIQFTNPTSDSYLTNFLLANATKRSAYFIGKVTVAPTSDYHRGIAGQTEYSSVDFAIGFKVENTTTAPSTPANHFALLGEFSFCPGTDYSYPHVSVSSTSTSTYFPISDYHLFCATVNYDTGVINLYANGVLVGSSTGNSQTLPSPAQKGGGLYFLNGTYGGSASLKRAGPIFGEFIVNETDDDENNSATRLKMEGYLAHKWGLTKNLPAGHPYKYEPPYKVEPEEIVTDGLVLNLDAGDYASYPRSGTTWYDISGNGLTGALTNGPTYDSANKGSIVFADTNDTVLVGNLGSFTAMTICTFMKRNGTQVDYAGVVYSRGTSVTGLDFRPSNNNLTYTWNDANNTYNWNSGLVPPDGEWCMVALTVTSSSAIMYLCTSSGISTSTNSVSHTSTTFDDLKIGEDEAGTRHFKGSLSTVQIYNRALSSTEISQNFNALRGRYGI